MNRKTLLSVNNLSVSLGGTNIVRNVSFDISLGEILALVGESGCGKTMTCLSVGGLLPRTAEKSADSMMFKRKNDLLVELSIADKRKYRGIRGGDIAYVFQEPATALNPVFTIGDQIGEVIDLHRPEVTDRRKEIISLLESVGIPAPEARIRSYPHELSGGMQQRVMIAMALAGQPRLLIADEPTTALDVTIQAQILDLLDRLRRERDMAVLLVTHNFGVVSRIADRVAVMYAGDIVEIGRTRDIIDCPRHPYTQALVAAVPRLGGGDGGELRTIPGMVPSPDKFNPGCRFYGRCQLAETLADADKERCRAEVPSMFDCGGVACRCHHLGKKGQGD